jgi:hypothetical protein
MFRPFEDRKKWRAKTNACTARAAIAAARNGERFARPAKRIRASALSFDQKENEP